jgi:hypothetical protein
MSATFFLKTSEATKLRGWLHAPDRSAFDGQLSNDVILRTQRPDQQLLIGNGSAEDSSNASFPAGLYIATNRVGIAAPPIDSNTTLTVGGSAHVRTSVIVDAASNDPIGIGATYCNDGAYYVSSNGAHMAGFRMDSNGTFVILTTGSNRIMFPQSGDVQVMEPLKSRAHMSALAFVAVAHSNLEIETPCNAAMTFVSSNSAQATHAFDDVNGLTVDVGGTRRLTYPPTSGVTLSTELSSSSNIATSSAFVTSNAVEFASLTPSALTLATYGAPDYGSTLGTDSNGRMSIVVNASERIAFPSDGGIEISAPTSFTTSIMAERIEAFPSSSAARTTMTSGQLSFATDAAPEEGAYLNFDVSSRLTLTHNGTERIAFVKNGNVVVSDFLTSFCNIQSFAGVTVRDVLGVRTDLTKTSLTFSGQAGTVGASWSVNASGNMIATVNGGQKLTLSRTGGVLVSDVTTSSSNIVSATGISVSNASQASSLSNNCLTFSASSNSSVIGADASGSLFVNVNDTAKLALPTTGGIALFDAATSACNIGSAGNGFATTLGSNTISFAVSSNASKIGVDGSGKLAVTVNGVDKLSFTPSGGVSITDVFTAACNVVVSNSNSTSTGTLSNSAVSFVLSSNNARFGLDATGKCSVAIKGRDSIAWPTSGGMTFLDTVTASSNVITNTALIVASSTSQTAMLSNGTLTISDASANLTAFGVDAQGKLSMTVNGGDRFTMPANGGVLVHDTMTSSCNINSATRLAVVSTGGTQATMTDKVVSFTGAPTSTGTSFGVDSSGRFSLSVNSLARMSFATTGGTTVSDTVTSACNIVVANSNASSTGTLSNAALAFALSSNSARFGFNAATGTCSVAIAGRDSVAWPSTGGVAISDAITSASNFTTQTALIVASSGGKTATLSNNALSYAAGSNTSTLGVDSSGRLTINMNGTESIGFETNGFINVSVDVESTNPFSAPAFYVQSDERLKTRIEDHNTASCLEDALQMKIKRFAWRSDAKSTMHTGLIAQEVEAVLPSAVREANSAIHALPLGRDEVEVVSIIESVLNADKIGLWSRVGDVLVFDDRSEAHVVEVIDADAVRVDRAPTATKIVGTRPVVKTLDLNELVATLFGAVKELKAEVDRLKR